MNLSFDHVPADTKLVAIHAYALVNGIQILVGDEFYFIRNIYDLFFESEKLFVKTADGQVLLIPASIVRNTKAKKIEYSVHLHTGAHAVTTTFTNSQDAIDLFLDYTNTGKRATLSTSI